MSKLDDYLKESVDNIRKDREVTEALLKDVMTYLAGDDNRHERVGQVAAKYVETLQRSNEQLVKVIGVINKKEGNQGLSDNDKQDIFDMLQAKEEE